MFVVLLGVLGVAAGLAFASSGPPSPAISSHPASLTNLTSASFSFTDSQAKVTFVCSLDGSSYSACTSPKEYSGLAAGNHTFRVEAKDTSGHASSATSYSWTIDRTPPVASSINRAAASPTNAASVSWTVTFSEAVTGVDAGDFQLAQSGLGGAPAVTGVAGAGSTYTVSASTGSGSGTLGLNLVDNDSIKDLAGNPLGGPGTGNGNFTGQLYAIDRTPPPAPAITTPPPVLSNSSSASFSFTDSEAGVTFLCSRDGGAFAACSSPKSYTGLSQGPHTFQVEARDGVGNLSSPAFWTWTVDTKPPPIPKITQHPTDPTSSSSVTFAFTDAEAGVSFECRLDSGAWTACTSPTSYSGLAAAEHNFYVRAVDPAGNRSDAAHFEFDVTLQTGKPFTISGNASSPLYPGAPAVSILVKLTNPNSVPIFVTSLTASLVTSGLPLGCESTWFQIAQSNISATQTVEVPASGSVTLPVAGATAPTVQMIESHTKQNACSAANLTFKYSGSAHS
jgi:hypothetical protein